MLHISLLVVFFPVYTTKFHNPYFSSLSREFLSSITAAVGEFDQRVKDEEEQVFPIKSVTVHEKYHHASPMSYDIALVELDQHIRLGEFLCR